MRSQTAGSQGFVAAVTAFTIWGFAPLFWIHLRHIDSGQTLAYRVLFSAALAFVLLVAMDPGLSALQRLRQPKVLLSMVTSTCLVVINWFVFLWAVNNGHVTEMSIGYYSNPLINIVLGRTVLGERLTPLQTIAVVCAAAGVGYLTLSFGAFPWVAVVLAVSFSLYGLVRKQVSMPALPGLLVETTLCAPFCFAYLLFVLEPPFGKMSSGTPLDSVLLLLSGVMTATPLLLFAVGARRLKYSTVGIIQYLAPTLQLGCAVFVFGESFTNSHLVTFGCIWTAVALYTFDGLRSRG